MGTESLFQPAIRDLEIVAEVIRLADACEAERHAQRPTVYRGDDLDWYLQPRPRREALVAHLLSLEAETVAALYAIFRCGDYPSPTASEAMDRYRDHFELAMEPMHRKHGPADLSAKGLLAAGLRRGLEHLDLATDRTLPRTGNNPHPATYLED
jgi:hypothetical protein